MNDKSIFEFTLFENIDSQHLNKFTQTFTKRAKLNKGDLLFRQGEIGDSMYLLLSGKLQVQLGDDSDQLAAKNQVTFDINPGAVIGEICVFSQKKRSATIQALKDTELLEIEGEKFRKLVKANDLGALLITYNISKLLSKRLVTANDMINEFKQLTDNPMVKSEMEHFRERFNDETLFN